MLRPLPGARRALLLAIVAVPCLAAAEPAAGRDEPGLLERHLPQVVGATSTVIIVCLGLILRSSKPADAKPAVPAEPLPPDVVGAPSPLRYLISPAIFLVLLAVVVPLGYSVWSSLPDQKSLLGPKVITPPLSNPFGQGVAPVEFKEIKITPLPVNPTLHFNPPQPIPQPPFTPVRPPQLPRR